MCQSTNERGRNSYENGREAVRVELLQRCQTEWGTLWMVEIFAAPGIGGETELPGQVLESMTSDTPVPVFFTKNPDMIHSPLNLCLDIAESKPLSATLPNQNPNVRSSCRPSAWENEEWYPLECEAVTVLCTQNEMDLLKNYADDPRDAVKKIIRFQLDEREKNERTEN